MLEWHLPDRVLQLGPQPLVLGIVNVTPDSFSDGGRLPDAEAAAGRGMLLAQQGADLLDVGGESTRPGARPVPLDEELARVLPVVAALKQRTDVPISVDTSKAEVARRCLEAGAHVINDVTALAGDPAMAEVVRDARAGVILMHMQGTPATMQLNPHYQDVTAEVLAFLRERLHFAEAQGIDPRRVVLDPGIGFGKTTAHSLELLAGLRELQQLGRPVCLGVSRKGVIGQVLGRPVSERLAGSLTAVCHAMARGAAQVVRVHDVRETHDAVLLWRILDEFQKRPQEGAEKSQ
jgi:dihydropteroate synthase